MENLDDEIIVPDESGAVHLNHHSWNEIPKQIIPGCRYTLIELDVSYNCISTLSDSIGLLLKLRRLNVSNNQLINLPDSLSQCQQLEMLLFADNKIQSIPTSFVSLQCLEFIDARNNCLQDIPDILSQIPCIKSIICSGNSLSFEIPHAFSSSGNWFLWYLKLRHQQTRASMQAMEDCYDIEGLCQSREFSLLELDESIHQLTSEIDDLVQNRPIRYLQFKESILSRVNENLQFLQEFIKGFSMAFRRFRRVE